MEIEQLARTRSTGAYARIRENTGKFPTEVKFGIFGENDPFGKATAEC